MSEGGFHEFLQLMISGGMGGLPLPFFIPAESGAGGGTGSGSGSGSSNPRFENLDDSDGSDPPPLQTDSDDDAEAEGNGDAAGDDDENDDEEEEEDDDGDDDDDDASAGPPGLLSGSEEEKEGEDGPPGLLSSSEEEKEEEEEDSDGPPGLLTDSDDERAEGGAVWDGGGYVPVKAFWEKEGVLANSAFVDFFKSQKEKLHPSMCLADDEDDEVVVSPSRTFCKIGRVPAGFPEFCRGIHLGAITVDKKKPPGFDIFCRHICKTEEEYRTKHKHQPPPAKAQQQAKRPVHSNGRAAQKRRGGKQGAGGVLDRDAMLNALRTLELSSSSSSGGSSDGNDSDDSDEPLVCMRRGQEGAAARKARRDAKKSAKKKEKERLKELKRANKARQAGAVANGGSSGGASAKKSGDGTAKKDKTGAAGTGGAKAPAESAEDMEKQLRKANELIQTQRMQLASCGADAASAGQELTMAEAMARAEDLKSQGNKAFTKGDLSSAVALYTEGLRYINYRVTIAPQPPPASSSSSSSSPPQRHVKGSGGGGGGGGMIGDDDEEEAACRTLCATLLCNRSVTHFKWGNIGSAYDDGDMAVSVDPLHLKAYSRRAMASMKRRDYAEAAKDFRYILLLEGHGSKTPLAKDAKERLVECEQSERRSGFSKAINALDADGGGSGGGGTAAGAAGGGGGAGGGGKKRREQTLEEEKRSRAQRDDAIRSRQGKSATGAGGKTDTESGGAVVMGGGGVGKLTVPEADRAKDGGAVVSRKRRCSTIGCFSYLPAGAAIPTLRHMAASVTARAINHRPSLYLATLQDVLSEYVVMIFEHLNFASLQYFIKSGAFDDAAGFFKWKEVNSNWAQEAQNQRVMYASVSMKRYLEALKADREGEEALEADGVVVVAEEEANGKSKAEEHDPASIKAKAAAPVAAKSADGKGKKGGKEKSAAKKGKKEGAAAAAVRLQVPGAIMDPYLGLVDVLENAELFEYSEVDASEKTIPRLFLNNPKSWGQAVVDRAMFVRQFNVLTEGQLVHLDWNNVCCAGGAVLAAVTPAPLGNLRTYYHARAYKGSDIDLFIYGLDEKKATAKIADIYNAIRMANPQAYAIKTLHTVTISSEYPKRKIQIVLRLYKTIAEVLHGFDVDVCSVAFDGLTVWASNRACRAMCRQYNLVDLSYRSPSYETRLFKYSKRGYSVACPGLDMARVKPSLRKPAHTYQMRSLAGLAKLVAWDASFRAYHLSRTYFSHGILYDDGQSEHTVEQMEVFRAETLRESDYQNFFIPYGPKWSKARTQRHVNQYTASANSWYYRFEMNSPPLAETTPLAVGEDINAVLNTAISTGEKTYMTWDSEYGQEVVNTKHIGKDEMWLSENPGQQGKGAMLTGSFHPTRPDDPVKDWEKGCYV